MTWDAAIVACRSYNDSEVERVLRDALDKTEGLSFVRPGMRVAVKVNGNGKAGMSLQISSCGSICKPAGRPI